MCRCTDVCRCAETAWTLNLDFQRKISVRSTELRVTKYGYNYEPDNWMKTPREKGPRYVGKKQELVKVPISPTWWREGEQREEAGEKLWWEDIRRKYTEYGFNTTSYWTVVLSQNWFLHILIKKDPGIIINILIVDINVWLIVVYLLSLWLF